MSPILHLPCCRGFRDGGAAHPERALSATVLAASVAVSSSPMSAATAGMIAFISSCDGVTLGQLMAVLVPTFFLAAIITSLSIFRRWTHRRRRHSWCLMDDGNHVRILSQVLFAYLMTLIVF